MNEELKKILVELLNDTSIVTQITIFRILNRLWKEVENKEIKCDEVSARKLTADEKLSFIFNSLETFANELQNQLDKNKSE